MQETPVWSLDREVPLEEGVAPTPVFLPGITHGHRNLVGYSFMGLQRVGHNWATFIKIKTYTVQRNCCFCCLVAKLCLTLLWSHELWSAKLLCPWDFLGKNTAMGCHFLLQGIFLTQGSNPHLLHWQVDYFTTEPPGKHEEIYIFSYLLQRGVRCLLLKIRTTFKIIALYIIV